MCCTQRKEDQVGRAILWLPGYYVSKYLAAVHQAEERLKRPVSAPEIFVQLQKNHDVSKNIFDCSAIINTLLREDMIFCDEAVSRFTTERKEGYLTYSEMFRKLYPGYICDKSQRVSVQTAKTLNFKRQTTMLKSTDRSKFEEWSFFGGSKLLDQEVPLDNERIALVSFPRAGSSFLRKLLESCSGIATGSSIALHTSTSLQLQGLKGEGITDNRVWVVKATHPAVQPGNERFDSKKVIVLVRNPVDQILSMANLVNTMTHVQTPDDLKTFYDKQPNWWDWWVRTCAENHADYFRTLVK